MEAWPSILRLRSQEMGMARKARIRNGKLESSRTSMVLKVDQAKPRRFNMLSSSSLLAIH